MQRTLFGLVLLVLACSSADANLADTTTFGVFGINANGTMIWAKANEWIAAMNTATYLGKSDWRLPTVTDTGSAGCNFAYTGTDFGLRRQSATEPGYDPG